MEQRVLCIVALKVCSARADKLELKKETAEAMDKLAKKLDPDGALTWAFQAVLK